MLLLDTNVWVEHLQKPGTELSRRVVEGVRANGVCMSELVAGEPGRVWKPPAAKATAGGAAAKQGEAGGCGPRMQPDAGSGFSRRATPSGYSDAANGWVPSG